MVRDDANIKIIDEVRKNEALLASLLENSSQPFGVGYPDGSLGLVNRAFEQLTGYSREELKYTDWSKILTPQEFRDMETEKLKELKHTGKPIKYEKEYIRKDGTRVPIELLVHIVKNEEGLTEYYYSFITDTTERKKAEKALKESEDKYRSIFNNMLDGFAYCKMIFENDHPIDFTYLEVNKSFEKLTGLKNVIGKNVSEVIPNIKESDPELLEIYGRVALTGQQEIFEMYLESLKMWFSVSVYSPQKEYFVAVFDVITERKQAEEEQKQLLLEIQHKEEELSALIENIVDEVWFCDVHGNIILANAAARKFENETEQENLKSLDNLISSVEVYNVDGFARSRDGSPLIRALNGEILFDFEEVIVFPSTGKKSYRNVTSAPIKDNNNKITGAVAVVRDITDRKKIEAELDMYSKNLESLVIARTADLEDAYNSLKESEEHYLTLFNSIDEGFCTIDVIFDSDNKPVDYRFLEINPAFEKQTGLHDAQGKLMRDLAPDHEENWFETYGKIALTGKPMRFVNLAKELNRWYDVYAFKVGDCESREVAILFNDITKFKETKEALELSSRYNRSLIEASLDPLVTIGPNGRITDVNKSTESATGYSRDEIIGTNFSDYFTEPEKAQSGYKQVFKEGTVHDYPLEIKHKNGEVTPVLYNASIYKDKSGEVIGVFASARDITQMKKAENKLREYQDTLEEKVKKRTEELAKSNAELEHFAYVASHDLREPLRMITSFLQLLERRYKDQLDHDADEFIGFAVDGAKRLDEMINDLLEYSRVTNKEQVFRPVKLENVLEEALINLIVPTEEHNAIIDYDSLPIVNGDEKLLVQLFQNLIGNAIKYHGQKPPKIHISSIKEKNQYIISIKDNGIGIDSQHLDRIFTIFQRLHRNDEYEGTGIGLAIAQKIVHQQGGEIWVESEPGKGSTFYFSIPIK